MNECNWRDERTYGKGVCKSMLESESSASGFLSSSLSSCSGEMD